MKTVKACIALVACILLAASCTKNEDVKPQTQNQSIKKPFIEATVPDSGGTETPPQKPPKS